MISSAVVLCTEGFAHSLLPDKHKALQIAEAMIDETMTLAVFMLEWGRKTRLL